MITSQFVRVYALIVFFFLAGGGFTQQRPAGSNSPADEAALRALVDRFFDAYARKDLTSLMQLWSANSSEIESHKKAMEAIFVNYKIEGIELSIRDVTWDGEKARVRVKAVINAVDAKTGNPAVGFGKQNRSLQLAREGAIWKVWNESSSEEELAATLIDAQTDEQRRVTLNAEKDLISVDLRKTLIARGNQFAQQGNFSLATTSFRIAREVAEQIDDRVGIALGLQNIGNMSTYQGDYEVALDYYQKSLALYQSLDDKPSIVDSLNAVGIAHLLLSNVDLALEYFQRALTANQGLNNPSVAASTMANIGTIIYEQGNYGLALEYFQKSLAVNEQMGDKTKTAAMLNNIGNVHLSQGNFDLAQDFYRRSLELREAVGDKPMIPLALVNLGRVSRLQGDLNKAMEYFQKSLAIAQEINSKEDIEYAQAQIGEVAALQGDYKSALEYLQKSFSICEEIGQKTSSSRTLNNIGDIYAHQGDYAKALDYFDRAAAMARRYNIREVIWQSRVREAEAYKALSQFDKARLALDEAIGAIESLRDDVAGGAQQELSSFENKVSPYQIMVDLLVLQNRNEDALAYAERSKARALLNVLSSGRIQITKAMTASEQEREREIDSKLVSLNSRIAREDSRPKPDAAGLAILKSDLKQVRLEREAFQTTLYAVHPELRIKRGNISPLKIEEASDLLPDENSALLEFVVTKDKTFLFVLSAEPAPATGPQTPGGSRPQPKSGALTTTLKVYTIAIKRDDLALRAEAFRTLLAKRDLRFGKAATELYDLLMRPARAQLKNKNQLIIVPDDALWQLPFQTLQTSNGRYLLEEAAIEYAPSLTVLRDMVKLNKKTIPTNSRPVSLLAIGNPAIGKQTIDRIRTVDKDARLEPLPEAEREVRILGQLYGNSEVFVGQDAREDRVKAEAGKFEILHLATHGVLNDASPMYSHLVFSHAEGSPSEDGLLEAWEMMKLDLKATLVVLSACDSGRGRIAAGEGIIGMSWALFVAGCPTAVVSQWKVDSASTTKLMIEFHKQLSNAPGGPRRRMNVSRSLREAALKLMHTNEYRHPFYWAGFIVVGAGS